MPFQVPHLARTIVVLGLCAASAIASAEIHRCKDEHGQTELSDRPCGAASSGQPLQPAALGGGAERLTVPDMHPLRVRDAGGQYEFMAPARPSERHLERQALK